VSGNEPISDDGLRLEQFPRSAKYEMKWMMQTAMGPNPVWLTEWLCEAMDLEPGMRVLDMGCGRAASSVFLAREFGVQVWATDLWIEATENWQRIREAGLEDRIFPIHAEARALPYADGFFDAAVSIDSYHYYGTDDLYLGMQFARLVRPGGRIGIVVPGFMRDVDGDDVPEHLTRHGFWDPRECWSFHTAAWWRRHFNRSGCVEVETADTMPDGWKVWMRFADALTEAGHSQAADEPDTLRQDRGEYLGFVRLVARRLKPPQEAET
jgi:SAM-dependent methyltransferase